ncbi:MAG: alkaline phosphatase family protein [Acidimicrobiales bacterium]
MLGDTDPGDERHQASRDARPIIPDYEGACITNIVPALLESSEAPGWFPTPAFDSDQVVLVVLDGLGWEQLTARRHLAPVLSSMLGGPIHTVLPTTTATALTSFTTGLPPGEHGVVGYRIHIHGEVLNVLRWSTATGDARQTIPPPKVQTQVPFLGHRPPVVTRAEFARTGFTVVHLDTVRFAGYRMTSSLVTEVGHLVGNGEPFVYAYYDGLDKVSHEYGLGEYYEAELAAADRLVGDIMSVVPTGTAVVVTSDHGQVHVGASVTAIDPDVAALVSLQSGEGRFRWLHARPGRALALLEAARAAHDDQAWVVTRDEVVDGGWLGPRVTGEAASRLGDVALVARDDVAFTEPTDTGPYHLIGRHGSATAAELRVPLLATIA